MKSKRKQRRREGDVSRLSIRLLTRDDWPILERLFGRNGACGGCWCMWWRVAKGGKTWEQVKGQRNRQAFRRLVTKGNIHAVFAFIGDEPVGWCSFGPRREFARLERARSLKRDWSEDTWSIVCFFIPSRWRGRGIATRLLAKAAEHAFSMGAREVEGYPVVPQKPTTPIPAAFAWTGVPTLFESAGFKRIRRPAGERPIYLRLN